MTGTDTAGFESPLSDAEEVTMGEPMVQEVVQTQKTFSQCQIPLWQETMAHSRPSYLLNSRRSRLEGLRVEGEVWRISLPLISLSVSGLLETGWYLSPIAWSHPLHESATRAQHRNVRLSTLRTQ